jgi:hypothetical protein
MECKCLKSGLVDNFQFADRCNETAKKEEEKGLFICIANFNGLVVGFLCLTFFMIENKRLHKIFPHLLNQQKSFKKSIPSIGVSLHSCRLSRGTILHKAQNSS